MTLVNLNYFLKALSPDTAILVRALMYEFWGDNWVHSGGEIKASDQNPSWVWEKWIDDLDQHRQKVASDIEWNES